jgi:hypothetical protein
MAATILVLFLVPALYVVLRSFRMKKAAEGTEGALSAPVSAASCLAVFGGRPEALSAHDRTQGKMISLGTSGFRLTEAIWSR